MQKQKPCGKREGFYVLMRVFLLSAAYSVCLDVLYIEYYGECFISIAFETVVYITS